MRAESKKREATVGRQSRWITWALMAVMIFTGMGHMPIYKRYGITAAPGLDWAADFYIQHLFHYGGALCLLGWFSYLAADYVLSARRRVRLTGTGVLRVALLTALVGTGVLRVLKNLPEVAFSPSVTLMVDLGHLVMMMAYVLAALGALALRKSAWVVMRTE